MTDDAGPAVDSQGRATPDPTENVLALVDAAVRRLDDLREMSDRLAEVQRVAAEKLAEAQRLHDAELRKAESGRINALREGDQAAIIALANQVVETAKALREAAEAQTSQIMAAVAELQRWQYGQQGGREQVTESRAESNNTGLWVGVAISVVAILVGILIALTL